MEKIKNVLHGHKKNEDEAAHEPQTSSTEQHQGKHAPVGQPVYDIKTTDGKPYTVLAQPGDSAALHGQAEHTDTDHHSALQTHAKGGGNASVVPNKVQKALPESVERAVPNAIHDTGDNTKRPDVKSSGTETSTASIKSGIIGFGPDQTQAHAALPANNAVEKNLSPGHVVGGGNLGSTGTPPTSQPVFHPATGIGAPTEQQPYDNTLRQQSYTADTDRSFSLSGGVASHHGNEHVTSTPHSAEPTSTLHQASIAEKDPAVQKADNQHSQGREGLAEAAAVAAAVGAAQRSITSDHPTSSPHVTSQSQPKEEQGFLAMAKNLIGLGAAKEQDAVQQTTPGSRSTHNPNPEAVAAATAAAAGAASRSSQPSSAEHGHTVGAQQTHLPGTAQTTSLHETERPQATRFESHHRHIPGEFISTPGEHGNTFLDYTTVIQPTSASTAPTLGAEPTPLTEASNTLQGPSSTLGSSAATDHELRHTGTLHDPLSKSAEDHHHAGGLGAIAGVAGVHAAHGSRTYPDADGSKHLHEETSPYSSKILDPRVSGTKAPLNEPQSEPQARTESGLQHHVGKGAGIVGGAAVGAAALHQHNDKSSTGSAVLPQESSYGSASSVAPQSQSSVPAPLASTNAPTATAHSTGDNAFYGTAGAPAPVADQVQHQQPLSSSSAVPTPTSTDITEKDAEHHHGRNAGVAGAGALGAASVYAATRDNEKGHVPGTEHVSGLESQTTGFHSSTTPNILDPKVNEKSGQQHDYSRDAAVAGGTGAAGYGAYEAIQAYGDHRLMQPAAAMTEQRYDPTAPGAKAPSPVAPLREYNYNDPAVHHNVSQFETDTQSNTGRNVAVGGLAGAGLVGGGVYAGSKHTDNSQQLPLRQNPPPTTQALGSNNQHYHPTRDPSEQSHGKRNAALVGAGGAAALGGGAYALSQQDEHERARLAKREQEHLKKEAHERDKEQHKLEKEQHKHDKEVHKHDKEVYKHDKAVAAHDKEDRHLQKEQEKEHKHLAKEQHEREKEAEKEKKGGLLGFLHRDKSKKDRSTPSPETSPRASRDAAQRASRDFSPRHSKEYAGGAGAEAGALGVGAMAYDENHPDHPRWKGKHLLHKEPPKGHPAREALEHPHTADPGLAGKREHVGIDGPIGDSHLISGDRETRKGVYGADPAADVSAATTVIEPHTGLPMNVGKYGPGTGGTDGNATIHGHAEQTGRLGQQSRAD